MIVSRLCKNLRGTSISDTAESNSAVSLTPRILLTSQTWVWKIDGRRGLKISAKDKPVVSELSVENWICQWSSFLFTTEISYSPSVANAINHYTLAAILVNFNCSNLKFNKQNLYWLVNCSTYSRPDVKFVENFFSWASDKQAKTVLITRFRRDILILSSKNLLPQSVSLPGVVCWQAS